MFTPKTAVCTPSDSTNWPLPTKISFSIELSGQFRTYMVVTDGQGHHGPGEYDSITTTTVRVPDYSTGGFSIDIDLSDPLVTHSLKGNVGHIAMVKGDNLPTINTGLDFVLDTSTNRITSLELTRNYTYSNSRKEDLRIDLKDVAYSHSSIQIADPEIRNHLTYLSYSSWGGSRFTNGGLNLVKLSSLAIVGTISGTLLGAPRTPVLSADCGVFSFSRGLKVSLQSEQELEELSICANDGAILRRYQIPLHQKEIYIYDLAPGLYFIRFGTSIVKSVVLP